MSETIKLNRNDSINVNDIEAIVQKRDRYYIKRKKYPNYIRIKTDIITFLMKCVNSGMPLNKVKEIKCYLKLKK